MGLDSKLVWVYIGIGVIANVITGLILLPLLKAFWARATKPAPMSLQDKVKLAEQLEMQQRSMERLKHIAANPKDLYLYLFQLFLITFLCVSFAECLLIWGLRESIPIIVPGVLILLAFAIAISVVAISQAKDLSEKNIDKTKAKLQKWIDDAKASLNLP